MELASPIKLKFKSKLKKTRHRIKVDLTNKKMNSVLT